MSGEQTEENDRTVLNIGIDKTRLVANLSYPFFSVYYILYVDKMYLCVISFSIYPHASHTPDQAQTVYQ